MRNPNNAEVWKRAADALKKYNEMQKAAYDRMNSPTRWQRFKAFLSYLNRGGKNPGVTGFLCIILSIMWWVSIANGYWIEMAITTAVIGAVYVYGSWRNYNGKQA